MEQEKAIIWKAAAVSGLPVDDAALAKINKYTLRPMTAEEVFVFKLAMCDNEIDRVFEVFPVGTLKKLAKLFVGRTIIADHKWSAIFQCARIYDTEVLPDGKQASTGEAYSCLVSYCYMLRTDATKDFIVDIEGGIKKEVSVGCRVGAAICSVCGTDNKKAWCEHMPGREYDGKLCYFRLEGAEDAYECSFVAVPAQRQAGVIKAYGAEPPAGAGEKNTPATPAEAQTAKNLLLELDLAAALLKTH